MQEIIASEIGIIKPDCTIHRILDGSWSLYELIEYVIGTTGPVHVFASSFSISEAAICSFHQMLVDGRLLSLECLLDSSLRKTKTDLLFFLNNLGVGLKLTQNHSKIILLANDRWHVSINASANMSRNRRIEALVMDTNKPVYDFYYSSMSKLFSEAVPFLP